MGTRHRRLVLRGLMMAAAMAVALPAAADGVKLSKGQVSLDARHFQSRTRLVDDALETHARLSTERGHQERFGPIRLYGSDNHLVALVDKRSGQTRFEVRQTIRYVGPSRDFDQVAYETDAWPVQAPVTRLTKNGNVCFQIDLQIPCNEELMFPVAGAELRRIAEAYKANPKGQWNFKFKGPWGHEHRTAITHAEIAGLMAAADDYRRNLNLKTADAGAAG